MTSGGERSFVPVRDVFRDPFFSCYVASSSKPYRNPVFLAGYHCVEYKDRYVLFKTKSPVEFVDKTKSV